MWPVAIEGWLEDRNCSWSWMATVTWRRSRILCHLLSPHKKEQRLSWGNCLIYFKRRWYINKQGKWRGWRRSSCLELGKTLKKVRPTTSCIKPSLGCFKSLSGEAAIFLSLLFLEGGKIMVSFFQLLLFAMIASFLIVKCPPQLTLWLQPSLWKLTAELLRGSRELWIVLISAQFGGQEAKSCLSKQEWRFFIRGSDLGLSPLDQICTFQQSAPWSTECCIKGKITTPMIMLIWLKSLLKAKRWTYESSWNMQALKWLI